MERCECLSLTVLSLKDFGAINAGNRKAEVVASQNMQTNSLICTAGVAGEFHATASYSSAYGTIYPYPCS